MKSLSRAETQRRREKQKAFLLFVELIPAGKGYVRSLKEILSSSASLRLCARQAVTGGAHGL